MKSERVISEPVVMVDTREQVPLEFVHLKAERGTLRTGDYSAAGFVSKVAIERKSVPDLVNSLTAARDRFWHELERLRGFAFARLLVVGTLDELAVTLRRRAVSVESVLGSLAAIDARYVPVVFAATPQDAAAIVEGWLWYFWTHEAAPFCGAVKVPEYARGFMWQRWNGARYRKGGAV